MCDRAELNRRLKSAHTAILWNSRPAVQLTCFELVAEAAAECGDERIFRAAHEQMELLQDELDRPRRAALLRWEKIARIAMEGGDETTFD